MFICKISPPDCCFYICKFKKYMMFLILLVLYYNDKRKYFDIIN